MDVGYGITAWGMCDAGGWEEGDDTKESQGGNDMSRLHVA
jgi:hypothetical protein